MTEEVFTNFWKQWARKWHDTSLCYKIDDRDTIKRVSELCSLKNEGVASVVYKNYEAAKSTAKELYFRKSNSTDEIKRISRYKRAAVMTFAVIKSDPLDYDVSDYALADPYFLKERLAVYLAIGSIIQDFPQEKVRDLLNKYPNNKLYDVDFLGIDRVPGDDTFIESLYKDIFLADLYGNYNVLSMANIYGLLTERCSLLSELIKPYEESSNEPEKRNQ